MRKGLVLWQSCLRETVDNRMMGIEGAKKSLKNLKKALDRNR